MISNPLGTVHYEKTRQRARLMVAIAWVFSSLLASTQALMFRYLTSQQPDHIHGSCPSKRGICFIYLRIIGNLLKPLKTQKLTFFITRLLKHPHRDFYQCTSELRLEMASDLYIVEGEMVFRWYGTDPKIIYAIYNLSFLFFVYFLPLACIVCGFLAILSVLKRKSLGEPSHQFNN